MVRQDAARLCPLRLCDREHKILTSAGLLSDWPAQLHAALDRILCPVRRRLDGTAVFLLVRKEVTVRELAATLSRLGLLGVTQAAGGIAADL